MKPRLGTLVVVASLALGGIACGRPVEEGIWQLGLQAPPDPEEVQDSCGLLAEGGESLGEARLVGTGVELRLFGVRAPGLQPRMVMVGRLRHPGGGDPDDLSLAGSLANAPVSVRGADCTVRFGQVLLQAAVEDSQRITGLVEARYWFEPSADPACPEDCLLRTGVQGLWEAP